MVRQTRRSSLDFSEDEFQLISHGALIYSGRMRISRDQARRNFGAQVIDFLENSDIPIHLENKLLLKCIEKCKEWVFYLDDSGPAQVLSHNMDFPDKHESSSSEESEISMDEAKARRLLKQDTEKPKKLWLMAGLHFKMKKSRGRRRPVFEFKLPEKGVGLNRLNTVEHFKLPWNIYCPTAHGERRVLRWKSIKRNIWLDPNQHSKMVKQLKMDLDRDQDLLCNCEGSCDHSCFNRILQAECSAKNCRLLKTDPEMDCGNRPFANLLKNANQPYSTGYEVVETGDKGYGLRAIRQYAPHALIVEYIGEVIDYDEMTDRLKKKTSHYYFLSLEKGFTIDSAKRGSVARFVNHSCDPNCEMQKWYVNGEPRIGLFAGPKGVEAGDEITYDYNFNWFPDAEPQRCLCGANGCRGLMGKRSSKSSSPERMSPKAPLKVNSPKRVSPIQRRRTRRSDSPEVKPEPSDDFSSELKKPPRKPRQHKEDYSFEELSHSLPPALCKMLSINMAPPGDTVDEVSRGMIMLAENAMAVKARNRAVGSRTRSKSSSPSQSSDGALTGIPSRFLQPRETGSPVKRKRKRVVEEEDEEEEEEEEQKEKEKEKEREKEKEKEKKDKQEGRLQENQPAKQQEDTLSRTLERLMRPNFKSLKLIPRIPRQTRKKIVKGERKGIPNEFSRRAAEVEQSPRTIVSSSGRGVSRQSRLMVLRNQPRIPEKRASGKKPAEKSRAPPESKKVVKEVTPDYSVVDEAKDFVNQILKESFSLINELPQKNAEDKGTQESSDPRKKRRFQSTPENSMDALEKQRVLNDQLKEKIRLLEGDQ